MTTEQKAKRYDEAIERVVNIRTGKCETTFIFTEGLFDYLFPELEECNEEEVKEAMIDFFKHEREEGVVVSHYGVNIERMIAWLEKQGQVNETIISQHENKTCKENNDSLTSEEAIQYLKENHSPSEVSDFQTAMNIAVAKAYDKGVKDGLENKGQTFTKKEVDDAYLAGVRDAKQELKKISQRMISAEVKETMYGKPTAWSEDDDDNMMMIEDRLRDYLDYIREDSTLKKHIKNSLKEEVSEYIDWLKSLKDKYTLGNRVMSR